MFDFWKEVIINSNDRLETVTNAAGEELVRVTRCADYNPKNVVDGIVYKTACVEGNVAEITLPESGEGRLVIELGLSVGQDSEFARPWFAFKKPIVAEFDAKHSAADVMRLAVDSHIGSVVDNKFVLVDPKVCVKKAVIETEDANGKVTEDDLTIKHNVVPVGTGEWILENLRFPTHVNTRVAAPNADDMPVVGGKYTQYAFEYCVSKRGVHGSGAVGQPLASVTHHVFYVLEGIDADAVFAKLGTINTLEVSESAVEWVPAKTEIPEDGE